MKNSLSIILIAWAIGSLLPTTGAAQDVMTIVNNRVVIGDPTPGAPLDIVGSMATNGAGNAVVRLRNPGSLAFQLDDTNAAGFWNFANAVAESEFRISRSGTGATELRLTSSGNLTITGQLVTGGATCNLGCDRVFDADYPLPSIEEHAQEMWGNRFLPAIGPTEPMQPINLSEQYGNVLNELETAHIYIDQLNNDKKTLQRKVESLESRLSRLESLINQ